MGAWGTGAFENDDALDWIGGLASSRDASLITAALEKVIAAGEGYLESPDCCEALAAAEILAALLGSPGTGMPDNAVEWIKKQRSVDTPPKALATAAIARIRSKSELKELWDESDSASEWYQSMDELEQRLK